MVPRTIFRAEDTCRTSMVSLESRLRNRCCWWMQATSSLRFVTILVSDLVISVTENVLDLNSAIKIQKYYTVTDITIKATVQSFEWVRGLKIWTVQITWKLWKMFKTKSVCVDISTYLHIEKAFLLWQRNKHVTNLWQSDKKYRGGEIERIISRRTNLSCYKNKPGKCPRDSYQIYRFKIYILY